MNKLLNKIENANQPWFSENAGRGGIFEYFELREEDNFPIFKDENNKPPSWICNQIYDALIA